MAQQHDSKGELRAAFLMRMIDAAQHRRQFEASPAGLFLRVTLAITFMYLILVSFMMFGVVGPIFVSVLALVAYFVPHLYRAVINVLERRKARKEHRIEGHGSPQRG
jgi:hypothetical protein